MINGRYQFGNDIVPDLPDYSPATPKGDTQNGEFDWAAFLSAPSAQVLGGFTNIYNNFYSLNDEFVAEFPSQFTDFDQFTSFGWYANGAVG